MIELRKEIKHLYEELSEVSEIVDMNLDYFPEQTIVTFVDALKAMSLISKGEWIYKSVSKGDWAFSAEKVSFELPVRNCCNSSEQSDANKYFPIYLRKDKFKQIIKK